MSVAIFGHDDFAPEDDSKDFPYIPVSGEAAFISVWEVAIAELGITRLSNGIQLKREELAEILEDFKRIKGWVLANNELSERDRNYVVEHIDFVLEKLPKLWAEYPNAKTLWMG